MEKVAETLTEGDSKKVKSPSSYLTTSTPRSGGVPWVAAFVVFSLSWCFLGWRHLDLEWRVGRLEGELEARLQHKLQQLGLHVAPPPPTHNRVARDVSAEGCMCPP
ncbi:hypothetical protein OTU49_005599, partial [Cherax quadricarinatus]